LQYASIAAMAHGDGEAQRAAARAWEARNRGAFLDAYREAVAHHDLVAGDDGDFATVLSAFALDKAVYEIAYDAAHRPDWVSIPLDGVRRLLEAAVGHAWTPWRRRW